MLILTSLVLIIIVGVVWSWLDDELLSLGDIVVIVGSVLLAFALITMPLTRMEVNAKIEEYRAVEATLATARAGTRPMESAAFQLKVAELNQWRASITYWDTTNFHLWIPAAVNDLEPIE